MREIKGAVAFRGAASRRRPRGIAVRHGHVGRGACDAGETDMPLFVPYRPAESRCCRRSSSARIGTLCRRVVALWRRFGGGSLTPMARRFHFFAGPTRPVSARAPMANALSTGGLMLSPFHPISHQRSASVIHLRCASWKAFVVAYKARISAGLVDGSSKSDARSGRVIPGRGCRFDPRKWMPGRECATVSCRSHRRPSARGGFRVQQPPVGPCAREWGRDRSTRSDGIVGAAAYGQQDTQHMRYNCLR